MLGLTSGVQLWVAAKPRNLALKTSPSGGARHSIETYVVIRDVEGLRPGIYHYAPDRHTLEKIRGPVSLKRMRELPPQQRLLRQSVGDGVLHLDLRTHPLAVSATRERIERHSSRRGISARRSA